MEDRFFGLYSIDDTTVEYINNRYYLFVSDYQGKTLTIIDVTKPSTPFPVFSIVDQLGFVTTSEVHQIAGNFYLFACGLGNDIVVKNDIITVYDISNPTKPYKVSEIQNDGGRGKNPADNTLTYSELGGVNDIKIRRIANKFYLFAAGSDDHGISIVDVTNPGAPFPVANLKDGEGSGKNTSNKSLTYSKIKFPDYIDISRAEDNIYLYVDGQEDTGFSVVDVTDPSDPFPAANFEEYDVHGIKQVANKNYLFAALYNNDGLGDGLSIIDVTDPSDPLSIATLKDGGGRGTNHSNKELTYSNVSDPSIVDIGIIKNRLYLFASGDSVNSDYLATDGISIIDVTNPSSPFPVSHIKDGKWSEKKSGDKIFAHTGLDTQLSSLKIEKIEDQFYIFAASYGNLTPGANRLSIINVTDPSEPFNVVTLSSLWDPPPYAISGALIGDLQSGFTLQVNFSEEVSGLTQNLIRSNFTLQAGRISIPLAFVSTRKSTNTLLARLSTEDSSIAHGDELYLIYKQPLDTGMKEIDGVSLYPAKLPIDRTGNALENFEIPIANPIPEPKVIAETPTQPDPTVEPNPPVKPDPLTGQDTVLANAQINKSATRISLEFTAALSTANTLSPFNFAITNSDGSAIDLRAVSVSKNNANQLNLKLNQGNQFAAGSTVQVVYTQPSNNTALTDAAGQPIESFSQSGISTKGTPVAPTPEPTTPESPPAKLAPIAKYDLYQYEGGKDNRTPISFGDSKQRRKRESGVLKNDLNVELDPTKNPTTFVTEIRLGGAADSGKAGIIGQPITGTYGRLTLNADGSYAYNATEQAAADLLIGETGFDDFTYTISDGTNSSSASFSFAIAGSKERPVEPNPDPINPPSTTPPEGNNTPATGTGTSTGTTINIENLTIKLGKGKTIDLIGDLISHAKTKGFLSANLFESSATSNQLKAKLPPQLGLSHQGTDAAATRSQAKLILKGIYSTLNSKDRKAHQRDANRYLSGLPGKRSARVDLRSITPESLRNNNQPLKTLGLVGKAKGRNLNEALILDGRNLPSQTNIRLDHIGFLSLFGDIRITSGKGDNHVIGDRAAQTINLGNGDDTVIGGAGQDTLHGGKGNDSLDGGNGDDVLIGGPGADQFRLSKGQDLIEDFNLNQGDLLITSNPGKLSIKQQGDNLLITGPGGIDTLLADVDRRAFLAADPFG